MEDPYDQETVYFPSTDSYTVGNRSQQLRDALNTQKDQLIYSCTSIIQMTVTNVNKLQGFHDATKIKDKKHLKRSENDFKLTVRLLTDGLKTLREFSEKFRQATNQLQGNNGQNETDQFYSINEKSYITISDESESREEAKPHTNAHETDLKFPFDPEETKEKGPIAVHRGRERYLRNPFQPSNAKASSKLARRHIQINHDQDFLSDDEDTSYAIPSCFESPIDLTRLEIQEIIGRGQFGEVRKGILHFASRETAAQTVGIKVLKKSSNENAFEDFRHEIRIMSAVAHMNIIGFIGTKGKMIVMEYAELGSLKKYLVNKRSEKIPLHVSKILQICLDVAAGMKYLAGERIIHRDMAARNILLTADCKAKIADFGLSKRLDKEERHFKGLVNEKIPIWWSPPEVLKRRIYSKQSDVWSFGVLMWEAFAHGKTPRLSYEVKDLLSILENKTRLRKTDNCPPNVYSLMTWCWKENPDDRPDFNELFFQLSQLLNIQKEEERFSPDKDYANIECLVHDSDYYDVYSDFFCTIPYVPIS